MRELKTWEMIKELTEDPSKKFECEPELELDDEGYSLKYIAEIIDDRLGNKRFTITREDGKIRKDLSLGISNRGNLLWKWTEVIEPVSYEVAYKVCKENSSNDNLIRYENQKTPWVLLKGINGVVSIHINKNYGNVETVNNLWIPID